MYEVSFDTKTLLNSDRNIYRDSSGKFMKYKFGEKIRAVRQKSGLTIKQVAIKAGVSESLVSQIETNRVSPAIDTLLDVASVLEMDLEFLFNDFKKEKEVQIVRAKKRNKIVIDRVTYEQLSSTEGNVDSDKIEAYYLTIPPGLSKGSSQYGHKGQELGIIVQGKGLFSIGTKSYELNSGDSLSFGSELPHLLKNVGDKSLIAYWIITPPKMFFASSK